MVITLGESLMDMVPKGKGYQPIPGGSPYNMALALARLGGEVAFLGRFSEDFFGRQLRNHLAESGVDMRWTQSTSLLSSLSFATLADDGGVTYSIYLDNTSGCAVTPADVLRNPIEAGCLHIASLALFWEPVASAIDVILDTITEETVVSVDPNIRPFLVKNSDEVRTRLEEVMSQAHILKCSDEDLAWLEEEMSPEEFCRKWRARGVALVSVTCGADGAVLMGGAGLIRIAAPQIQVSDTIGAGDTFQAGLLVWLQKEGLLTKSGLNQLGCAELQAMGEFAAQAAALTCSRSGCNPPTYSEVEEGLTFIRGV